MMALEVRIREIAKAKGFNNVAELQRASGLTYPQTARLWQGGDMQQVSLRALSAIAKALDVPAKDLLMETEEHDKQ